MPSVERSTFKSRSGVQNGGGRHGISSAVELMRQQLKPLAAAI
jgi:hypothetical protein